MTKTLSELRTLVIIGVASSLAYVTLYNPSRGVTTPSLANILALAITAIANTAAKRHITFGVRGRNGIVLADLSGAKSS